MTTRCNLTADMSRGWQEKAENMGLITIQAITARRYIPQEQKSTSLTYRTPRLRNATGGIAEHQETLEAYINGIRTETSVHIVTWHGHHSSQSAELELQTRIGGMHTTAANIVKWIAEMPGQSEEPLPVLRNAQRSPDEPLYTITQVVEITKPHAPATATRYPMKTFVTLTTCTDVSHMSNVALRNSILLFQKRAIKSLWDLPSSYPSVWKGTNSQNSRSNIRDDGSPMRLD